MGRVVNQPDVPHSEVASKTHHKEGERQSGKDLARAVKASRLKDLTSCLLAMPARKTVWCNALKNAVLME